MRIMSSGELADIIGVTTQSISNYRRKEGMPYVYVDKIGHYFYGLEAIEWFLVKNKRLCRDCYRNAVIKAQKERKLWGRRGRIVNGRWLVRGKWVKV